MYASNTHALIKKIQGEFDELAVYRWLTNCSLELGFESSRAYTINECPLHDKKILSLCAKSNASHPNISIGYKILKPTLQLDSINQYKIETANEALKDEDKKIWIKDFELETSCWIDLKIEVDGKPIALWGSSINSNGLVKVQNNLFTFLLLAEIAGMKIGQTYNTNVTDLADEFSNIITNENSQIDKYNQLIVNALKRVQKLLNCQFAAYFQWEAKSNKLVKLFEIDIAGEICKYKDNVDNSYKVGEKLTGTAYINEKYSYLPFFENLSDKYPELVDDGSLKAHQKNGLVVKSVLYKTVSPLGAAPGLIRVINRADESALPFTRVHEKKMARASQEFDRIVSIFAIAGLLVSIKQVADVAFDMDYSSDNLPGEECLKTLGALGVYLEVQTKKFPVQHPKKILPKNSILEILDKYCTASDIGIYFEPEINNKNYDLFDVLRTENVIKKNEMYIACIQRESTGYILLWSELRIIPPNEKMDDVYWKGNLPLANTLKLIMEICTLGIRIRSNIDMLRVADEAIAVIAHEFRSPSVALKSISGSIIENILIFANQEDLNFKTDLKFTDTESNLINIESKLDLKKYLLNARLAIENNHTRLSRAVRDGLLWANFSSNVIEIELAELKIQDVIREAIAELKHDKKLVSKNTLNLTRSIDRLPGINGVKDLLQGLFVNLIDNAFKYSYAGEKITISAGVEGGNIFISIENFGLGIDAEDIPHIFTPFYRARKRDRKHTIRGVGLGLPTCNKIVKIHQGSIAVKSDPKWGDPERLQFLEGYSTKFLIKIKLDLPSGRQNALNFNFINN